jgi:RNA 2',3'-cyclic 3'-phosphodiesterase
VSRLFVAVWPPESVLDDVERLPRPPQSGVRWTTRDQWHVTLRFFGEADVDEAVAALSTIDARPADAVMGPRARRLGASVVVLPVAGLDEIAAAVVAATAHVGRPSEDRPFHGHLTLARLRDRTKIDLRLLECASTWPASSVALVESRLHPHGARYTTVAEVAFG